MTVVAESSNREPPFWYPAEGTAQLSTVHMAVPLLFLAITFLGTVLGIDGSSHINTAGVFPCYVHHE